MPIVKATKEFVESPLNEGNIKQGFAIKAEYVDLMFCYVRPSQIKVVGVPNQSYYHNSSGLVVISLDYFNDN